MGVQSLVWPEFLGELEAMAAQIGPALLEPPAPRLHDRVYQCLGPDRWVAAEADLDEAWTRARPAEAVADALQGQRIAAGAVQDGLDLVEHDPQLRARGFYPVVEHPRVGDFAHEGVPEFHIRSLAELDAVLSAL